MRADVGRALRNKSTRAAVKTRVVRVRRAIADHAEGIAELGIAAITSLDKAASKGILHANNAARRKSRLMRALNATEQAPAETAPKTAPKTPKAKAKTTAARSAAARTTAPAEPAPAKKAALAKPSGRPAPKAKAARAAKAAKPAAKAKAAAKKK
jgi:small subunit ribosomal protein S20